MASGFPQPAGGMFLADGFGHQLLADAEDDAQRIPGLGDGQPSSQLLQLVSSRGWTMFLIWSMKGGMEEDFYTAETQWN